jgi:hypothetical protein
MSRYPEWIKKCGSALAATGNKSFLVLFFKKEQKDFFLKKDAETFMS